ncbi:hypothetical protein GCM10010435_59900 [Winogradskya consettensis]|uniref:Uncharacterized protein n=1 Tax=Winogradskya consettensis TaxID=113560 RepID=A0A919SPA3_9ACTN|nr:hypothetical protein [Actinoplanes consettensis]GIM76485.1 hypothetical protein Aco04nite_50660 [Actinoplanes consettensis]
MKTSQIAPLHVPHDRVDLEEWIFSLSDEDYRAASPQHRAAGVTCTNGVRGTVNVESIGGTLIIQHYREVTADAGGFELLSERSRAYLFHLFPARAEVRWTMAVEPGSSGASHLRCTVELTLSPLLNLLAATIATPFFVRRHVRNEIAGFARDIEAKYAHQNVAGDGGR